MPNIGSWDISSSVSEETIGTRRKIKPDVDLEILGPKRDAAKAKREAEKIGETEIEFAGRLMSVDAPKRKRRRRSAKASSRTFPLLIAATLIMVATTLAAFFLLERYQPVGDTLLADPPFSLGLVGWDQRGNAHFDPRRPAWVTLGSDDPESRTSLKRTINLPPGLTLAFLEATVSTERVVAGDDLWQRARVYLVQLDEAGKPNWNEPHHLFRLSGTEPKQTISQVFPIPDKVDRAQLSLEMNNVTGRMTISDLRLYPVEELPGFRQIATGLMAAWAVLLFFAAIAIFKNIPSTKVRLALGAMVGIFAVGLFMPAPLRDALIDGLNIPSGGEGGIEPDLIGHGIVFAIMAFLVRVGRPTDPIGLHLGCWALIAVASETLQLFTFDREPSIADFLVDGIGVVLGLTLAVFLPRLLQGRFSY